MGAGALTNDGGPLNLTSAEFELLQMFFEFTGQVLTTRQDVGPVLDREIFAIRSKH